LVEVRVAAAAVAVVAVAVAAVAVEVAPESPVHWAERASHRRTTGR